MEELKITSETTGTLSIVNKEFEIDFSKVTQLKDVVEVLKGLNIKIHWYQKECPNEFKTLYEKGYLKEVVK